MAWCGPDPAEQVSLPRQHSGQQSVHALFFIFGILSPPLERCTLREGVSIQATINFGSAKTLGLHRLRA